MAEAKHTLAAILAADVAGYSRLMAGDDQATVAALDVSRTVFRDAVGAEGGRVVDTAGDSILAVFETPSGAVRAALTAQAEIKQNAEAVPEDRRMLFRIGVTLGEVIEKPDGTVYGDGVNIAARLEAASEPGGIIISGTAYDHVHNRIDVGYQDLGTLEVKNIPEPVRAYRLTIDGTKPIIEADSRLKLPDKPSIAVLAFDNLSGDPEQEYFADGIAEDLVTALSRIRWLFVIARNSSFSYKGKSPDVRQVGHELGVRYVLEGSVRKGGNRIRVSAQLIDSTNGAHVWAERYDRELTDLFDLQDEITATIAAAIEPEIGMSERDRARRKPPDNLDAWESYQLGLWNLYQLSKDTNIEAHRLFKRAVEFDPGFASALAASAHAHILGVSMGFSNREDLDVDDILRMAETASSFDDKDGLVRAVLGRVHGWLGNYSAAIDELGTAIMLQPSLAIAHYFMGFIKMSIGRPSEGIDSIDVAARLSPHDPLIWLFDGLRAIAHNLNEDYELSIDWAERTSRRPGVVKFWPFATMASSWSHLGRYDEARRAIEQAQMSEPRFSYTFMRDVWPFNEHHERYFEGLRKAGLDVPDKAAD